MTENKRMYVLVRESAPLGLAMAAVGHAVLGVYLKFKNEPDMQDWLQNSFRKVVCKVTDAEFEAAQKLDERHLAFVEPDWNNREIAVAFCPKEEWPTRFKFFRLYRAA